MYTFKILIRFKETKNWCSTSSAILLCFRFKATMQFYQYQPKGGANDADVDPKDFFALWSPFCSDFKDIWKKEQQRLIKEK